MCIRDSLLRSGSRIDCDVDETPLAEESAEDYVERVTMAKLEQGRQIVELRQLLHKPILAADTTLELEGEIIGKPVDEADAAAILRRLDVYKRQGLAQCPAAWNHWVFSAVPSIRFISVICGSPKRPVRTSGFRKSDGFPPGGRRTGMRPR